MAVKIDVNGAVNKVYPMNGYFDIEMIAKILGGRPAVDPVQIGNMFLVFFTDDVAPDDSTYNTYASGFLNTTIFGPALAISYKELPPNWSIHKPNDFFNTQFTSDDLDNGFIRSINEYIVSYLIEKELGELTTWEGDLNFEDENFDFSTEYFEKNYFYGKNESKNSQKEVIFIHNVEINEFDVNNNEKLKIFLKDSYDFILKSAEKDYKDLILYEDNSRIIKVKEKNDWINIIEKLIDIFEKEEEYEKCQNLIKIKKEIESNN